VTPVTAPIPHSPFTRCLVSHFKRKHSHWISRDLAFRRITFSAIIVSFSLVPLLSSCFEYYLSYSLVKCLAECDSCFVCRNGVFCYSLLIKRLPLLYLVWRLDLECHQCPAVLRACAPPRVETVLRILLQLSWQKVTGCQKEPG